MDIRALEVCPRCLGKKKYKPQELRHSPARGHYWTSGKTVRCPDCYEHWITKPTGDDMGRNTSTLRNILFEELESLRDGTGDYRQANAVAKLASQIISTAKVEMDFCKLEMKAEASGKKLQLGAMDLGEDAGPAALREKGPQKNQEVLERHPNASMAGKDFASDVNVE